MLAFLCVCPGLLQAENFYIRPPRYAVYDEDEEVSYYPPVKLAAAAVYSKGLICDNNGDEIGWSMAGLRADAKLKITSVFYVGLEGARLWTTDQTTKLIHTITRDSGQFIFQLLLTPATETKLYMVGGIGRAAYRASFKYPERTMTHHSTVWTGGVGAEYPISGGWYVNAEYRFSYDVSPWKGFMLVGPRTREEWSFSVGYCF